MTAYHQRPRGLSPGRREVAGQPQPLAIGPALATTRRRCLRCRRWFPSYGLQNRICPACKNSHDWQTANREYRTR